MSAVKLNTVSGGSISLTPQDTASDVVLTVPAGTSTVVTNATLPTQLNASGSAPIYACRAWVNFNGTGTPAIRASGNVTSITDIATGKYTVNFTTAMPDANFATSGTAHDVTDPNKARFIGSYSKTTGSCTIVVTYQDALPIDATNVELAIFR